MTGDCAALYRTARAAIDRRDAVAAASALSRLFAACPRYPPAFLAASLHALQAGRPGEAAAFADKGLALAPADPALHVQRLRALIAGGDHRRARDALPGSLAACAAYPDLLHEAGNAAVRIGAFDAACRAMEAAYAAKPAPAIGYNLATVLRYLGRFAEAETVLDRVIAARPDDGAAWLLRSQLRRQTEGNNHISALRARIAGAAAWDELVPLHFALGKEHDDLGAVEAAADHFARGYALRRRHLEYDAASDLAALRQIEAAFPRVAAPAAAAAPDAPRPIFILGLPRSGTTLIERILGRHAAVTALGELNDFPAAVMAASGPEGRGTKAQAIAAAARADPEAIGAAYRARIAAAAPYAQHVTDKLPVNALYAGLIATALPEATILLVERHPLATAWGIWRTLFHQGYPFAYDLDELGAYMAGWYRLMAHWRAVLGQRLITVSYDALVKDPAPAIARLLAACGLPFDAACLSPEEGEAPVTTESAVQVRAPISPAAATAWRRYAAFLEPVRRALSEDGVRLG